MGCNIAAHFIVDRSCGIRQRLFQIDDGRQRIELDRDVVERVLGEIAALRQHHRQGFADVTHLVLGQRHLRALVEDGALDRRRRDEKRTRSPILAEIVGGVDRNDTLARARRRNVDRTQTGVGDVAAEEGRIQHPGKLDIVDEQRLPAQQPRVFVATDRSAEISRRHARYLRIRSAASCMASTIC